MTMLSQCSYTVFPFNNIIYSILVLCSGLDNLIEIAQYSRLPMACEVPMVNCVRNPIVAGCTKLEVQS